MAGKNKTFTIGSTIRCKTCHGQEVEGEVQAYDEQTKMVVLKCPSSSGKKNLNDVHMINLSFVKEIQVKKKASCEPKVLMALNLQRLNTRLRNEVDQKKRLVKSLSAGVNPEGQKLFITISRTINEVAWSGPNIVVSNQITIKPPYKPENIVANPESRQYIYIKKVVEKYHKDQASLLRATSAPRK